MSAAFGAPSVLLCDCCGVRPGHSVLVDDGNDSCLLCDECVADLSADEETAPGFVDRDIAGPVSSSTPPKGDTT